MRSHEVLDADRISVFLPLRFEFGAQSLPVCFFDEKGSILCPSFDSFKKTVKDRTGEESIPENSTALRFYLLANLYPLLDPHIHEFFEGEPRYWSIEKKFCLIFKKGQDAVINLGYSLQEDAVSPQMRVKINREISTSFELKAKFPGERGEIGLSLIINNENPEIIVQHAHHLKNLLKDWFSSLSQMRLEPPYPRGGPSFVR